MIRSLPVLTVAACLFSMTFSLTTDATAQDDNSAKKNEKNARLVGQRVFVTKHAAEIQTKDGVQWKSYVGEVHTVSIVNGEWLWIHEKGGWLWDRHAIPFDTAVEHYTQEIGKSPTAENYHLRGLAQLADDKPDAAIADFTESIRRKSQNAGAYNNRGNAYQKKGDLARAEADFSSAIQIDARNFVAWNNRGIVRTSRKQFDAAMNDLTQAIQLEKEYAEAWNNRGVVWREKGDFAKAIADYSEAIRINSRFAEAHANRGFAHKQIKNYDAALADLSRASLLSPLNHEPINDMAWLLATSPREQFRDGEKALTNAQESCKLTENKNWNCLDTLAAAYAELQRFDAAIKTAKLAIDLAPSDRKNDIANRLKLYESGKPYRDE